MKTRTRTTALKKLLDLCDDLHRLRHRIADPELGRDTRTRLRRQSKRKADQLARDLAGYRFRGPLGQVMREFKFTAEHFQVIATLLHRHARSEEPALEGRLILGAIFDNSFDVLSGMELLHENGPLRTSGLVVLDEDEDCPDDLLEVRFRISDEALQAFREEAAGFVPEDLRRPSGGPYGSNRDFLIDLRILHNLYKHRSDRVFNQDRWDRMHSGPATPARGLSQRIAASWSRVRRRLELTAKTGEFPAVRLMREHGLVEEEMIIVVHLLFKELYEGNAHADAADVVRLVSASEGDLIRNRRYVMPGGPLVRADMIHLEPLLEGRPLTGEVHLQDWVVNELFGGTDAGQAIQPDERLDWHIYLQNLRDTGTFFRDLEAN